MRTFFCVVLCIAAIVAVLTALAMLTAGFMICVCVAVGLVGGGGSPPPGP